MIGHVYELRFMRWRVTEVFQDKKEEWARLQCLDKHMEPWDVPQTFLIMMIERRVS